MLHLEFVRRLHQMRGTSLLSGVLIPLSARKSMKILSDCSKELPLLWGAHPQRRRAEL
ncbi:hypothetical protein ACVXHB_16680 [Escherichia coli]